MGIYVEGGMIVGAEGGDLKVPEGFVSEYANIGTEISFDEWAEEVGLSYYSMSYDAPKDVRVYGFVIKDKWSEEELTQLVEEVSAKMKEFHKITGVEARLFGMQNVW